MPDNTRYLKPAIRTRFSSHGTLGSRVIKKLRRFYEQFLGLKTTQTSPISLMIRLGGKHVYAVDPVKKKSEMPRYYQNGNDVETPEEIDKACEPVLSAKEEWRARDHTRPVEQYGTYHFWDIEGKGHFKKGFRHNRPDL